MEYSDFVSSEGLKTSTTVKEANVKKGEWDYVDVVIQNLRATKLHLKWGAGASETNYDVIMPACTVALDGSKPPYVIENFPDRQVISCWSPDTPGYTRSYR